MPYVTTGAGESDENRTKTGIAQRCSAATGSAKQQARTGAPAAAKAAGAPVSFSSATRDMVPVSRSTSDFDVDRVNAMRAAIANGTFQFSAQAVADKMLATASEMLSPARA